MGEGIKREREKRGRLGEGARERRRDLEKEGREE